MAQTPIETIFETEHLRLSYLPGDGDGLVVAFTGIKQQMGKMQDEEFIGVSSQSRENHVLFVTDKQCTWYSQPDMADQIVDQVQNIMVAKHISWLLTLGNSMGGYGALLFGERLNARVSIGFSPQYSMRADIIKDPRWNRFRPYMFEPGLDSLQDKLTGKTPAFALFGARDALDMEHLRLLKKTGNVVIWNIARCGHGVAAFLKEQNKLAEVFNELKAIDHARLANTLGEYGVQVHPETGEVR